MGRTARGVRGIRMAEGHSMISLIIPRENGRILTIAERGYGKRTPVTDFPTKGRGNQGVIAMQTSERNGSLIGAVQVFDGDEMMLITDQGTLVRTRCDEVSELSRNTQGVRVIRLREAEHLVGLQRIEEDAEDAVEPVEGVAAEGADTEATAPAADSANAGESTGEGDAEAGSED